jgi:DNA-binding CsgD family transcriptional regulator
VGEDETAFAGAAELARAPLRGALPAVDDAGARAHGLYWLTAGLAARAPLLLLVDDAQWVDEPTLVWLAYCARRLGGLPAGLVVAARDGEGSATLAALRREPELPALRPAPLGPDAVRAALADRLGAAPSGAVVEACVHASGGNPFLLTELLGDLGAAASADAVAAMRPERVTDSVARRLAELPPSDAALVHAVAILGESAQLRHAAELAGLEAEAAVAAGERLAARAILDPGAPLRFAHPMIREAVYGSIAPARRRHEHGRAARLLRDDRAAAAAQLVRAEPAGEPWAAEALLEAGRTALAAGDTASALAFLERAGAEAPPPALAAPLGRALGLAKLLAGRPGAIDDLRGAIPGATSVRERADIAREVALALLGEDRLSEGAELLEEVADGLDLERDRELRLRVEGDLACLAMIRSDMIAIAARRLLPLAGDLRGETPGERILLGAIAGLRDAAGEPLAETWPMARAALDGGGLVEHSLPGSRAWVVCANLGLDYDRMDEVAPTLDHALRDARERGSVGGYATACAWRAQSAWLRGDLHEAEAEARAALAASSQPGAALVRPMAAGLLLAVLSERGPVEEADALMAELADRDDPAHRLWAFVPYYRARVLLQTGRADQGVAELVGFGRHIDEASLAGHRWQWRTVAAPHLAARGERELALALAREELAAAEALPPSWRGAALRSLGVALGGDEGLAALREAEAVLAGSVRRLEHAHALVELGAALRRAGDPVESRAPLREGLDHAARCGSTRLAERARSELLAAGGRPRRASLHGVDALTPSELQTARMAAAGLGNAEIAQAMFVTTKTVEAHLTRAYRKLGVGRDALGEALGPG